MCWEKIKFPFSNYVVFTFVCSSTGGDDYGDRNESFWPRFVHEINE